MKRLDDNLLKEVTNRLVAEFAPEQVILFGSHAWGTPSDDSDVDLLLVVRDSEQPPTRRAQRAQRCLGSLRVPADILVRTRAETDRLSRVRTSLVARVLAEGKVLYG